MPNAHSFRPFSRLRLLVTFIFPPLRSYAFKRDSLLNFAGTPPEIQQQLQ